ncbi:phosphofructokinase domain-containing protein [Phakopsora pachyrhizi]|uniref:6-phosphofructokinase n=1 Tax=Phakopsora pachyrhizi TaxID=170000 RepID=A0AAV0AX16_PHAPC|nr:phosphofructokinase domain-containing protein [Phakopsora pachyrhizi]CAH7673744.1 phosphofructokinase domain-containing protein [Phakopsora pachyrhizi]
MTRIAVLTSGGDSAGMNAAVRSVVRMGITKSCEVYVIREGWEGLVRGNEDDPKITTEDSKSLLRKTEIIKTSDRPLSTNYMPKYFDGDCLKEGEADSELKGRHIIRVGWDDVGSFLQEGGTLIGTQRSKAFREVEGRRKAALNLIIHGIHALIVCGGDGSLTGADRLRAEWPDHVQALLISKQITSAQASEYTRLIIVGLVGSIDNDMAMTDMTIGAPTALHRICESIDNISSTASSHSRAFVVEVMGRNCGWLALMAGMSSGADYVFIPEKPPAYDDWEHELCEALRRHREVGKRKSIVIVAEGAIDKHLNPIKASYIASILTDRLKLDTRVTTLGHTQRGGRPCAYDRLLATLQGIESVEAVLDLVRSGGGESPLIGIAENQIIRVPLMKAVATTQALAKAIADKDFKKAIALRDPEYRNSFDAFAATTRLDDRLQLPESQRMRIGIMHIGAPAGGMNAATRTAVRFCITRGHTPLAIQNSWNGLIENHVKELNWLTVDQWTTRGGSELGTNRKLPDEENIGEITERIRQYKFDGLLLIGGFEVLRSLIFLEKSKDKYPELKIPIVHLPATISNNVPVTEWSLGSDTSINVLVEACDAIRKSASASRSRVFVVETQGGQCGYIAVLGALATGASVVHIPEEPVRLQQVALDVQFLQKRFRADRKGKSQGRILVRSDKSSSTYNNDVITKILNEEGKDLFDARQVSLGHTLQGGIPSPRDRTRAVGLSIKCIQFLERHCEKVEPSELISTPGRNTNAPAVEKLLQNEDLYGTIVITGSQVRIANLKEMTESADFKNRRGLNPWWKDLKKVVEIMGGRMEEGFKLHST